MFHRSKFSDVKDWCELMMCFIGPSSAQSSTTYAKVSDLTVDQTTTSAQLVPPGDTLVHGTDCLLVSLCLLLLLLILLLLLAHLVIAISVVFWLCMFVIKIFLGNSCNYHHETFMIAWKSLWDCATKFLVKITITGQTLSITL